MWIRVTCLLAFHMPRYHLDLTFHYPIEALYKEPFGYIEMRRIEEQETNNPWMLLIAYTLLIIYARVGLTPLYSILVLFDVVERENC